MRDYFELAVLRRFDEPGAWQMRGSHGTRVFVAEVVITFPLGVPFVNWFTSVIAAKFIVLLFEGMNAHAGFA